MTIPSYDLWKLNSGLDDEKVFGECRQCGGEIYALEIYYAIDGDDIHSKCLEAYVKDNIAQQRTAMV